jgi:uncharacterized protein (DUF1697 family)
MPTWIALLRGINVVGRNKVSMTALAALLEQSGFESVRTYLQSGNVVFNSASRSPRKTATHIGELVSERFGCTPRVLVVSSRELATAIRNNPFRAAERNHKSLHLYFLFEKPPRTDLASLARIADGRSRFSLRDRILYFSTPDGYARSALRPKIERMLGANATARNWRTVNELLRLATARP